MSKLEKVIRGLRDIDMFIAGRLEHEKAKNFLRTIDETIALLKEQKGLMLALEQSNAVNGFLNAEVERLNGLLKKQEAEWIEYPECLAYDGAYSDSHIVCSACKYVFSIMDNCTEEFDYCPHCGAKMKQEGR